ncbi:FAD/NAD(P)-binding domain-containing protein [Massarina eburnea CBS 473.64]|uniref:FAD/NAD(P)-binding domain-containing protein n=1 Tax=Massarina eburnea CBS 473.64 TaxID=1395130 RepID=A0A6A6SHI5_9PLEO|nr:FAD/NAD(P)-binding domain-containing protein [Massarina eburnea CBS 473.64]
MASTTLPTPSLNPDSSSDFNIAIIGAGIGGLALAIGLSHLSIPFTIYESAPAFSAVGAGVGLGPNALHAMDLIDSRFRKRYMEIATGNLKPEKRHVMMEAMRMETGLGEGEGWWGNGGWPKGYTGFERTGAHRKDLLDIMTSFIRKEAVFFNKRVSNMWQANNTVTLEFEDGDVVQHAAVVGCDGVKGFSRRIVLGERHPEHVEPKYTGKYVYRAILPMKDAKRILGDLATDAKMYMSKGANISTYPISKGKQMNIVAFRRDEGMWTGIESTKEVAREEMVKDFTAINLDPRLMELLDCAKPTRWGIFNHPTTPTYYSSLICLLGDVAHASSPHQGAGAGQGLEDSLILYRVLGRLCHTTSSSVLSTPSPERLRRIEAAFRAYDEVRRPRAQEQVRTAEETGELYQLRDKHGREVRLEDAVRTLNGRFRWIWEGDLDSDVRRAEGRFDELVKGLGSRDEAEGSARP